MTDNTPTTRRQYVKALTTATVGATAVTGAHGAVAQADRKIVFEQDFESLSTGAYPADWTKDGNSNQQVVEADAASGSKCLQQHGSFGGCWQALANAPVDFPASYSVRIAGAVNPLEEGSYGCHDRFRCYFGIRTKVGSWSAGKGYRLLNFKPDGTVRGRTGDDTVLGEYTTGEWNRFAVGYRPTDSGVEFTFRINGKKSGPFVLDAKGFEDKLSYLKFASGDFNTQWDDLSVSRLPAEVSPLERQSDVNEQSEEEEDDDAAQKTEDSGGIPVLNRFGEDTQSLGLGVGILGALGAGGYALHRRDSDDQQQPQPPRQRGNDPDQTYDQSGQHRDGRDRGGQNRE